MTGDPVLDGLLLYALIGLGVAIVFLLFAIDRIDEAAYGAYAVRPLLVPGIVMLWPVVLVRWRVLEAGKRRKSS